MSNASYETVYDIDQKIAKYDAETQYIYVFGKQRKEGTEPEEAEVRQDTTEQKAKETKGDETKVGPKSKSWEAKFPDTEDQTKWKLLSFIQDLIERMRFRVGFNPGTAEENLWLEEEQADWVQKRRYSLTMPRSFFLEAMRFSKAASFGMTGGISTYKRDYAALTKDWYVRLASPAYGYSLGGLSPQGRADMQKAEELSPPGSMMEIKYIPDVMKFMFAQIPGVRQMGYTFTVGSGKCWPL